MKLTVPRSLRAAVAALALVTAGFTATAAPSAADTAAASVSGRATDWYLALGDSLAAGFQPGLGDDKTGGYTGRVLSSLQVTDPKLKLSNLSCSGEDLTTMMQGGRCAYEEGSQLAQALVFLHAHTHTTRLVTVTIGANDVQRCVRGTTIDLVCINQGLANVQQRLPQVLAALRSAAPEAQVVVTNYYNPFLAAWFVSPPLAAQSSVLQGALNAIISGAATATGSSTADVATAFRSLDTTPLANGVPTNVATICQLTWMCTLNNIHANDQGYATIASAVLAVVKP